MTTMNPWMPERSPVTLRRVGKKGEEASELAKVCFRIVIQGIDGIDPANGKTNRQALQDEIADVLAQCDISIDEFDLDRDAIAQRVLKKKAQMAEWESLVSGA